LALSCDLLSKSDGLSAIAIGGFIDANKKTNNRINNYCSFEYCKYYVVVWEIENMCCDLLSKSDGLSVIAIGGFIDANKKQIK
jgi:hypothetical protein